MKNRTKSLWIPLWVVLALSVTVGCQTGPKIETVVEERPDGVVVVQTVRTQATVVAIDAKARTVRLKAGRGEPKTFKVSEGAVNFEQIRVGDEVHAQVIQETAVSLVPGGATPSVGLAAAVSLAPQGSKPGLVVANTVETTATIVAIDGPDPGVPGRPGPGGRRRQAPRSLEGGSGRFGADPAHGGRGDRGRQALEAPLS